MRSRAGFETSAELVSKEPGPLSDTCNRRLPLLRTQRPLIPIAERPVKGLAPTHGVVERSCRVIDLRREEQPEECCDQENLRPGMPPSRFFDMVALICRRTAHAPSLDSAAAV